MLSVVFVEFILFGGCVGVVSSVGVGFIKLGF